MTLLLNPHAAPSAALPVGAATPTPPAAPSAPSAPDFSSTPVNPVEFHKALTASLVSQDTPPNPAPAAALESPAAPAEPPAAPAVPTAAGVTPDPAAPAAGDDDVEPSAEVLNSLSDAGRRALQSEREKRKEARAQVAALQAELAQLKAQPLQPPAAPQTPPGQSPVPAAAPSAPTELAHCETFEAVDACAMHASTTEATALQMNTVLATEGLQAVQDQLKGMGIETFRGIPVEAISAGQLAEALASTMQHARAVQLQANSRKAHIAATDRQMATAVTLVPGLKDPNSEAGKQFKAILAANPGVKQLGPHWPVLVANQIIATEAIKARTKAPAAVLTPTPAPTLPTGPTAPRTSGGTGRQPTERETLSAKVMAGTASAADMRRLTALNLAG